MEIKRGGISCTQLTLAAGVILLCQLFLVASCGTSDGEKDVVAQAKKPVGAGDAGKANAKLEQAVRAKLDGDPQLKAAQLTVSADVTRNAITLSGMVPSEELRKRAVAVAQEAQAGVLVNDRIIVKSKSSERTRGKNYYA